MSTLSILFMGLLLGIRHATEADHLAAVATLTAGQSSTAQTMKLGIAWGIGHTLTLMLFGGLALWLGTSIPPRMEQALELAVSVMLVALGADVLRRLIRKPIHFHVHSHGPQVKHVHAHSHTREETNAHASHHHVHQHMPPLRALAVGMMHGMAGSAALIALSLTTVSTWSMGFIYIATFGVGSILGMALLSVAITIPLRWFANYLGWWQNAMTGLVGGFSCTLGTFMFYQIGVVDGLVFG